MELTQIQKIILAAGLLIIIGGVFVLSLRWPATPPHHVNLVTQPPEPSETEQIVVHVAGAVHQPGLYRLPPDARVVSAIRAAGGFTGRADRDSVNLAARLVDGQKLIVETTPPAQEPAEEQATGQEAVDRPRSVPNTRPLRPRTRPSESQSASKPTTGRKISINTAQPDELAMLPGIGEILARRIVYHRHQNGPFQRIKDLTAVRGIGEETLQQISPYITL